MGGVGYHQRAINSYDPTIVGSGYAYGDFINIPIHVKIFPFEVGSNVKFGMYISGGINFNLLLTAVFVNPLIENPSNPGFAIAQKWDGFNEINLGLGLKVGARLKTGFGIFALEFAVNFDLTESVKQTDNYYYKSSSGNNIDFLIMLGYHFNLKN